MVKHGMGKRAKSSLRLSKAKNSLRSRRKETAAANGYIIKTSVDLRIS